MNVKDYLLIIGVYYLLEGTINSSGRLCGFELVEKNYKENKLL